MKTCSAPCAAGAHASWSAGKDRRQGCIWPGKARCRACSVRWRRSFPHEPPGRDTVPFLLTPDVDGPDRQARLHPSGNDGRPAHRP